MTNQIFTYIGNNVGFSVSQVEPNISNYDNFANVVSKDKRVIVDDKHSIDRFWIDEVIEQDTDKLGIAKQIMTSGYLNGELRYNKTHYDWAFQLKDDITQTYLAGLYRTMRPEFCFQKEYSNLSESPFVLISFGFDVAQKDLENSINQFYDSTGLSPLNISHKNIDEFNEKKKDVVNILDNIYQKSGNFNDFSNGFNYSVLQAVELFDRFVFLQDWGW